MIELREAKPVEAMKFGRGRPRKDELRPAKTGKITTVTTSLPEVPAPVTKAQPASQSEHGIAELEAKLELQVKKYEEDMLREMEENERLKNEINKLKAAGGKALLDNAKASEISNNNLMLEAENAKLKIQLEKNEQIVNAYREIKDALAPVKHSYETIPQTVRRILAEYDGPDEKSKQLEVQNKQLQKELHEQLVSSTKLQQAADTIKQAVLAAAMDLDLLQLITDQTERMNRFAGIKQSLVTIFALTSGIDVKPKPVEVLNV